LQTLDGESVSLSRYARKVTVVAMWGTFCAPCLEELPMIEALHQKLAADPDVAILAVSVDEVNGPAGRAAVAKVAHKLGLTVPILLDVDEVLADRLARPWSADPVDGGELDHGVPTLGIFDAGGRYFRRVGFELGVQTATFVAEQLRLIDAAKRGALPAEELAAPNAEPEGAEELTLPAMSNEEYRTKWPALRAQLKQMLHLDQAALAAADRQARSGKPVVIRPGGSDKTSPKTSH
jgi:thiol-disulfide isomerase/thioredoxin